MGALLVALAFGRGTFARPNRPVEAQPAMVPAQAVRVQITEQGEMTEVEVAGRRLKLSSTAGTQASERELTAEEQRQLSVAARRAVEARDRLSLCGEGEVFLSVTVDGKTRTSAVCPKSPNSLRPWRDLLAVTRAVASAR